MKHEMIIEFQKILYEKLSANTALMKIVNGVFSFVPKDTKFPYIYLGKMISIDWSTKSSEGIQVLCNINIFSKAQGNKEALEILFLVNNTLDKLELNYQNKFVVNMKLLSSDVEQNMPNATFQAIAKFRVNIERLQ